MARHVRVLVAKSFNDNSETDPADTLAKKVFDTVNGKTVISTAIARFGQNLAALLVFDD